MNSVSELVAEEVIPPPSKSAFSFGLPPMEGEEDEEGDGMSVHGAEKTRNCCN